MKVWKYGIIVCLCSIVPIGLSINIALNDNSKSGNNLETEILYNTDNGYVSSEYTFKLPACDCGENGECIFEEDVQTCKCVKGFSEKLDGKCYACDCGDDGECIFEEDLKTCNCVKGFSEKLDGKCYSCDCGDDGKCIFEKHVKTCKCNKGFSVKIDGKCHACDCGPYGYCTFNGNNEKICTCKDGYAGNGDICIACDCGYYGKCSFNRNNEKRCICKDGYIENGGICTECDCGLNGECHFDNRGIKYCNCVRGYEDYQGTCKEIRTSTSILTTFIWTTSTPSSCDCGVKSFGCKLDYQGRKRCFCMPGYAQKGDMCSETCSSDVDCLNGGVCQRTDDAFFCVCPKNYFGDRCQVNAACDALKKRCDAMRAECRLTRDGAACECPPEKAYKWFSGVCEDICDHRKCMNGKCEITGKSFKCICDEGFTGFHCEEKITKKEGLPAYIIGSTLLFVAILVLTLVTLGLVCVLRRFIKVERVNRDIE